jgi:hypothetical protein
LIKKLMVSVTVIGVVLFGMQAPARAEFADCPTEYFCIWTGINGTGSRYQWSKQTIINGTANGIRLGSGITNRGYSFYNRLQGASWAVNIYDSGNCNRSPWYRTMQAGQGATAQGSDWGGRVSSIQLWNASPTLC